MVKFKQLILPGDVGSDVVAVKHALQTMGVGGNGGMNPSPRAGQAFVKALKVAQRQNRLVVDGKYGKDSHRVIAPHFTAADQALYRRAVIRTPAQPPTASGKRPGKTRASFTNENRGLPLWETVSYHDVPMFRALALALDHAQEVGAAFAIYSADRRDAVLASFNKRYGTNLHGQAFLVAHQNDPGFNPANPPDQTSHCLFSDGNPAYRLRGRILPARARLPRYFLGIDAADLGPGAKQNDCSMLIGHLERLGYHVTRPYHSGSEAHHFCFTSDPTPVLRHWKRIGAPAAEEARPQKPKRSTKPRGATAGQPVAKAGRAKTAAPTSLSPDGAKFIARFEGFRSKLYNDPSPARNATIGFGHLVHAGPITGKEPREFQGGITKERGLELLRADAGASASAVKKAVTVPLTQPQFDALVSFTFNLGAGNLQQSTLLKKLNQGQYAAVPQELKKWVKADGATLPGLVKRRNAEGILFSSGRY